MAEIGAFSAYASVSTLLQTNRTSVPTSTTAQPRPEKIPLDQPFASPESQSYRLAGRAEDSVFTIDLTAVGKGREDITAALSARFEELLEIFHGQGKAGEALADTLSSVSALIDAAVAGGDVDGIQLNLASVVRNFGAEDGSGATYGSVTGFAIEVGLVRAGRVNAEDVQLVGIAGERVDLTTEQRRTGIADGLYKVREEAPFAGELAALRGENKAQVEALRHALDRLQLVRDALSAYRKGDTKALENVEQLFRSGTLDAGALRAISDSRNSTQAVVPGIGVIGFK